MRRELAIGLCLLAAPAWPCVRSEGDFVPRFLLREDSSGTEGAAAAKELPTVDRFDLRDKAVRIADAACEADPDNSIAAGISVYAHLDGTAVELEIMPANLNLFVKSRELLLHLIKSFGVGVRKDDAVVIRLIPFRIGGDKIPRVVALIRSPGTAPEFLKCSDPACLPIKKAK